MQLNMNFTDSNPLKETLASANFIYLLEFEMPPEDENLSTVYENINSICEYVKSQQSISSISLTDRMSSLDSSDPVDLASKVTARSGKEPIIHLSGKGHSKESIQERLATISSNGINNILALSGDYDESLKEYTDSVDIIKEAKSSQPAPLVGAAVNPFK